MATSEITDEPADHLPNSPGQRIEALELALLYICEIESNVQMALYLDAGGLSDGQIADEFNLAVTPKTLSNVSHDGNARPLDLIPKSKISGEWSDTRSAVNLSRQLPGELPTFNILESRYHHTKKGASPGENFSTRNEKRETKSRS